MNYKLRFAIALLSLAPVFANGQAPQDKNVSALLSVRADAKSKLFETLYSLPVNAQSNISETLGRDAPGYYARTQDEALRMENTPNQLAVKFTPERVEVSRGSAMWAMAWRGYGYGNTLQSVDKVIPKASLNRVEYRHGSLTEWYINGPMGLEQGFTVNQPPGGFCLQPLTIVLGLSGDLNVAVDRDRKGMSLKERHGKLALSYAGVSAHDAAGKELPAWLEVQGHVMLLRVDDKAAGYPVTVDPFIQLAKLTAADGMAGDLLGISVGIGGNTVVAGAVNATVGSNQGQGAAYVFVKPAGDWANMTESAKLTASDGQAGDGFGGSVSISGNTIVVGACPQSGVCNGAGKVYVFIKPTSGWKTTSTFEAELTASDGTATDGFSNMLGISADRNTVVVGASGATVDGRASEGAAYVFVKPSGGWVTMTETAKLTEPDGAAYDDFGNVSVSGAGSTVFVGAFQLNLSTGDATGAGKAYIFVKPATGWKTTSKFKAKLTASDGAAGDIFGFCQAGSMCISTDGTTVLVGAPQLGSATGPTGPGKAYVFVKPACGWATTSKFHAELTASDGQIGDAFGWSAAITDNVAVVGAVSASAAYIFAKPKFGWQTTSKFSAKLTPSDGSAGGFGFSSAISGHKVVVGALNNPGQPQGAGAAFLFGCQPETRGYETNLRDDTVPVIDTATTQ
jgi:FG-GAP repeat protein